MPEKLTPLARTLRRNMTDAERRLWHYLRQRPYGFKFRRQQPVEGYIADFACHAARLIVEADGSQHMNDPGDIVRTRTLGAAGWRVMRFWNTDILRETEGVVEAIAEALRTAPPPQSGGD